MREPRHVGEQIGEYLGRALRVGIRERRAADRPAAEMIEPGGVALQAADDLAQARGAGKLAVEQGEELAPGGQPAHPRVGAMRRHQSIERVPGNMLQQTMKAAILVLHGVALLVSKNVAQRPDPSKINAVRHVQQNPTGQPWACPGHPRGGAGRILAGRRGCPGRARA